MKKKTFRQKKIREKNVIENWILIVNQDVGGFPLTYEWQKLMKENEVGQVFYNIGRSLVSKDSLPIILRAYPNAYISLISAPIPSLELWSRFARHISPVHSNPSFAPPPPEPGTLAYPESHQKQPSFNYAVSNNQTKIWSTKVKQANFVPKTWFFHRNVIEFF